MKNSLENVNKRRNDIINIIKKHNTSSIQELTELTGVSEMTIRRDCKELVKMGKIQQSRGIVSIVNRDIKTNQVDPRCHIKDKLAEAAASYINDNDFISINSSSTAIKTLKYIKNKNVVVHTNNANVINLKDDINCTLVLSGGELSPENILVGSEAINSFNSIHSNLSIIGCAGINVQDGISTPVFREADVNRSIINNCQKLILVADYSKIGYRSNFTIGNVNDIDVLITDSFADKNELDKLQKEGIEVIQVPI